MILNFSRSAGCGLRSVVCGREPASQGSSDLPAPRAPKRIRVTQLEQVLPNARILVRRPYSWLVGAHYGLGLMEGEKLLIVASGIEPLVVQALVVAAQEMGVTTDVIAKDVAALTRRMGREEFDSPPHSTELKFKITNSKSQTNSKPDLELGTRTK